MQKYAIVLLALLLVACGGGGFQEAIIGTWDAGVTEDYPFPSQWVFYENGRIIIHADTVLGSTVSLPGTYEFEDDDTITLHLEDAAADESPGRRDIEMPDDNTLILTAPVSQVQTILRRAND